MNFFEKSPQNSADYPRNSSNENINFSILAIRRMSSSGDLWPPPDPFFGPLDRATKRPRFQSNSNIIQPKKFLIVLKGF